MSDDEGQDEARDGGADDETPPPPPPAVARLRVPPQKAAPPPPRPPLRELPPSSTTPTMPASSLSNLAKNGVPPSARVRAPLLATTAAVASSSSFSSSSAAASSSSSSSVRVPPVAPQKVATHAAPVANHTSRATPTPHLATPAPPAPPVVSRALPRVGATKSTTPVSRPPTSTPNAGAAARPPVARALPTSTSMSAKRSRAPDHDPDLSDGNTQETAETLALAAADDDESRDDGPEPGAEQDAIVLPSSKRARLTVVPRTVAVADDAKQKAPAARKVAPKPEARDADRDEDDNTNGSIAAAADGGGTGGADNVELGDEKRDGGGKSSGGGGSSSSRGARRAPPPPPPPKIGNTSANRAAAVGVAAPGVGRALRKEAVDEKSSRGPIRRPPPERTTAAAADDDDADEEKGEADTKAETEGIVKKEPEDEAGGAAGTASAEPKTSNWTGGLANSKQEETAEVEIEAATAGGKQVREKHDGDSGGTTEIGDSVGGGGDDGDGDGGGGGADEDDYAEFATWHGTVFKKMCALVVAVGVTEGHMTFSPHGLTIEATPPTTGAVLQLRWRRRFWKPAPFQCSRFPFMVGQPFKEMLKLVTIANGDSLDLVYKTNSGVVLYRPQTPSEQTKKIRQQQQQRKRTVGGGGGGGGGGDGQDDADDDDDAEGERKGGGSRQAFEARIVRNIEISGVKLAVPNAKIPSRSLKYRARITMPHARAAALIRDVRKSTSTDLVIEMTPEFMSWTVGNSYGLSSFEFVSGVSQHLGEDMDDAELEQMANAEGVAEDEEDKVADDDAAAKDGDDERPKRGGVVKRKAVRGGNEAGEEDDEEEGSAPPRRNQKRARHANDADGDDGGGGGGGRDRRGRGGGGDGGSSDEEDLETLVARENEKTRQAATRAKRKAAVVKAQPKKKLKTEATIRYQSKSSFAQKLTIKELAKFVLQPKITEFVTMSFHPMLPCRIEYKDDELDISVRYYLGHQEKTDDEL